MDLSALGVCLTTPACVVTQTTSGLIVGMLLFLVAAGLTLIFGVLKIVNFAHGTFYMLGGYVAYTTLGATDSYTLAVLSGTLAMALFGVLFERVLISRVYGSNVLMQLLICYAVVLIFDDLVKIVWGPEFHAMGMPAAFQVPPLFIAGGVVPPFYAVLIGIAALIAIALGLGLSMTRFGKTVRAAAINPQMVSALGVNTTLLFAIVFAIGGGLAGLGRRTRGSGALALARHGLLDPDRELHRHGDRRHGLHRGRAGLGVADRHGSRLRHDRLPQVHGWPDLHRDDRDPAAASAGPVRSPVVKSHPALRDVAIAAIALIVVLAIPLFHRSPAFEDFVIRLSAMALFATSLNLLVGNTGMVSFGHGMFYGLGAYAFALMMQMTDLLLPVAAVLAVLITTIAAFCVGAICVRLGTDYFAFITLAVQMLLYSIIISWQTFTGGDQGLRGGIPRREIFGFELASQLHLYQFCAIVAVLGLLALRHVSTSPFGQTLRMIRDNENRASFLGVVLWRARLRAFTIAGAFAGLGGVLAALFVSGAYPELADWPNSGQAIFAVMLGGINSFLGPVLGAMILLALNDVVTRFTEYQGLVLGLVILAFTLGLRRGVLDFLKFAWPGRSR